VRGTLADHLQHGIEHSDNRPESSLLTIGEATQSIEMAEELVRSVDQMNDHVCLGLGVAGWATHHCNRTVT
jgi:hypothetical protein